MDGTEVESDLARPPALSAADIALFADLDGTLARIEPTPADVGPDPERRRLLRALGQALHGRLAVVSGRSLEDLDRLLEGEVTALGAVHGLVRRRSDGVVLGGGERPGVANTVRAFRGLATRDPGLIVEDKGAAATLHFRLAPTFREACLRLAAEMAERHGLSLQPGDMVVEVRGAGPHKGAAVESFLDEPPFAGARPVFLGDDFTDENGFRAAERRGGFGVIVGPRRPTAATYALPDVRGAAAWLWSIVRSAH